jgi:GntR family transcriptional regulator
MLRIDPSDPRPIWRQIEDGVRHLVARGALPPGESVPSVRDLARDLQVNPATVSKAYQRLTDDRVLVVHRGEGTFVADRPPALPVTERDRLLGEAAIRYASRATTLGAPRPEAIEAVGEALDQLAAGRADERGEES